MWKEAFFALSLMQQPVGPAVSQEQLVPLVVRPRCDEGKPGVSVDFLDDRIEKREIYISNLRTGQSILAMDNFWAGEPTNGMSYDFIGNPGGQKGEILNSNDGDTVKVDVVSYPGRNTQYSQSIVLSCAPQSPR